MIQFRNVTKVYPNGLCALSNVNFTIANGEFVFIVGASGAGKTTLIKLLLKEIEPTSGSIIVDDVDLSSLKRKEIPYYRRKLGVVFQDFRLLPDRTAYENVAFAMEIVGASPKEIRRRVPAVLSMVGLGSKAHAYPHQLSGGEQQRVALARALVNNPSILIADEPTGNLDPVTAMEIMKIINLINRRGTTVIMATHAKSIVNAMRKRVLQFRKGVLIKDEQEGGYFDEP
ncbi:cell division ATP-binding protein FtsE [Caldicoprobacter algeriensis]|nr:cell division ATP-binding protein FtsE [Caldicoprobacter algeriensis]MCM8900257.1 cell division ATP-binding protein FtsE [Caldicoprobacter algeriensis]